MFVFKRDSDGLFYSMWGWTTDASSALVYRTTTDAAAAVTGTLGAAVKAPAPINPTVDVQNGAAAIFGYGKRP